MNGRNFKDCKISKIIYNFHIVINENRKRIEAVKEQLKHYKPHVPQGAKKLTGDEALQATQLLAGQMIYGLEIRGGVKAAKREIGASIELNEKIKAAGGPEKFANKPLNHVSRIMDDFEGTKAAKGFLAIINAILPTHD